MDHRIYTRRDWHRLAAAMLITPGMVRPSQEGRVRFRLSETAGLRRFGYPVHVILPAGVDSPRFRLESPEGTPLPAQFRPVNEPDGTSRVHVDFAASPGPLEAHTYTVRFGPDVEPGPGDDEKSRIVVARRDDRTWEIGTAPTWTVRAGDHGLGLTAGGAENGYLGADSAGLRLGVRGDDRPHILRPGPFEIRRAGAFVVALSSQGVLADSGIPGRVAWSLDLTFPRTKSWVEIALRVDDPDDRIGDVALDLGLRLEGPALVDFGASNTVYGVLKGDEAMELRGAPGPERWRVDRADAKGRSPFAIAPPGGAGAAEGWAHIMDGRRCTAAALEGFGAATTDRIAATARGGLVMRREFPAGAGRKGARWWLHFVPMPVQIGAATSPQAMLSPLRIEWLD